MTAQAADLIDLAARLAGAVSDVAAIAPLSEEFPDLDAEAGYAIQALGRQQAGPLAGWKELSGRGDEMQDVFFFTKEAIDVYFKGRPFAVTVVGAVVNGWKQ